MSDLTRTEYREDMRHLEDTIQKGFGQIAAQLETMSRRVGESEVAIGVLQERSLSNTKWSRYIGPLMATLAGLLSGQFPGGVK